MLPLEIVLHIAKYSANIWNACASVKSEYHDFFNTETSKKMYQDLFVTITVEENRIEYRLEGKLHRDDDLPAVIDTSKRTKRSTRDSQIEVKGWIRNTTQKWYKNGKLHRKKGPAIIYYNGDQEWCQYGLLHRSSDEPAIIRCGGSVKKWYLCGILHRAKGPAVIGLFGYLAYWKNGEKIKEVEGIPLNTPRSGNNGITRGQVGELSISRK